MATSRYSFTAIFRDGFILATVGIIERIEKQRIEKQRIEKRHS